MSRSRDERGIHRRCFECGSQMDLSNCTDTGQRFCEFCGQCECLWREERRVLA